MKRILMLLIVTIPLLSGCWSRQEVNDIAIVLGVALDKAKNGHIQLALQMAVPKAASGSNEGSSSAESTTLVSAEGSTIMDAYRIIQEKLPREVFFAHGRVIVIGEELARDGVSSILDFFSRHRQAHLRNYLLFTKGEAIDILQTNPQFESFTSEEIREKEKTGVGISVQVRDFFGRLLKDGEEPIAAQISNLPVRAVSRKGGKGAGTSKVVPSITGTAVFQGDRLIGWLDDKETRGILWIRNEFESGVMTVPIPKGKGGGRIGAQIFKVSTKIKPILHNNKLKVKIETYGEVEIFENDSRLDLSNPAVLNTLQLVFEKYVQTRMQLTLDKAQKKLKSDIFGFGQAVYRANPKKWETYYKTRWYDTYPNLEVEIAPHIRVQGTGFTTKEILLPETKK
ncbi:Ger(x)C family spore germination protein [Ectobacillus funiculus]|uniref:Ger(X)C family spore germination protein n=1 Tax=Ectobacillus funiculus TaxID=137993 RepID=A0ABV5WI29_9BACI